MKPVSMMRALLCLTPSVLFTLACHAGTGAPPSTSHALLDAEVAVIGPLPPHYLFNGKGHWMLLGPGWAPVEATSDDGDWRHFAWVINRKAQIGVDRIDLEGPADFVAWCTPFDYPGRPEQVITVSWNGTPIGTHILDAGWQLLRFPLPPGRGGLLGDGIQLSFSRAASPASVGLSDDPRRLSAACNFLAVVPRGYEPIGALIAEADRQARDESRIVRLQPGNLLTVPVPGAATITLTLPRIGNPLPTGCAIEARLESREVPTHSWRQPGLQPELRLEVSNLNHGTALLRLRARAVVDGACDGRPAFDLTKGRIDFAPFTDRAISRSSVVLYVIDTLRQDAALSAIATGGLNASALADFRRESVWYSRARSTSSWTLPSVVSILSGTYPDRHGIMRGDILYEGVGAPSLAELLGAAGYETIGISHSFVASSRFGIDEGFDHFLLSNQLNGRAIHSQEVRRAVVSWLHTRPGDQPPFLAYIHTVEPHRPYSVGEVRSSEEPAPRRTHRGDPIVARMQERYQREADRALAEFGAFLQLLKDLNLYADSTIVLTSDHGEEFAEHDAFDHGRTLFEEQLRVPLWIKYPRAAGGGMTYDDPVSLADLAPTLLATAQLNPDSSKTDGSCLQPQCRKGRASSWVFSSVNPIANETYAEVDLNALILADGTKCLESRLPTDHLGEPVAGMRAFDLSVDPEERDPRLSGHPLHDRCLDLFVRFRDLRAGATGNRVHVSDETREQLRALGYIR